MKNILTTAATVGTSLEIVNETARTFPRLAVLASLEDFTEVGGDGTVIAAPSALHAEQAVNALERGRGTCCQKALVHTGTEYHLAAVSARGHEVSIYESCDNGRLQNPMIDSVLRHPKENTLAV